MAKKETKTVKETKAVSLLISDDGAYFTAKYDGEKIRGRVTVTSWDDARFFNAQEAGEEICPSEDETYGLPNVIEVNTKRFDELEEDYDLTDIKLVTDARIKTIIDKDSLPEILGFSVAKRGDIYEFGCGAVKLTKEQIENFIKIQKKKNDFEKKLLKLPEYEDYDEIQGHIRANYDDEYEHVAEIDLDEVKALIK